MDLALRQHGVIARPQLIALGMTPRGIEHRLARGRLHPLSRGVYAVGRPAVEWEGRVIAGVLGAGPEAVVSHDSAAALWGIGPRPSRIDVSVPVDGRTHGRDVRVHHRYGLRADDVTKLRGIRTTSLVRTLLDVACGWTTAAIERAVGEADRLGLTDPETLRKTLDAYRGEPGVRRLREVLDARTFRLTDSELERRFLRLVLDAGLPLPETGRRVNGFKVDFFWPELRLAVETDGITYHRTPAQQERDRIRDQTHTAAGLTTLRFTHAQVAREPRRTAAILAATIRRLKLRQA